ncbi:hypothetical protein L917_16938 [Phytophthora nicotianae]|uniref:Uncharacterized protein n=1 Tax=Phytophthora nicotianae TaxID=4792 RepID=W2KD70_PHYNI|nr:hypothetical protein L917_16938 [Phytophthora nicotianae]
MSKTFQHCGWKIQGFFDPVGPLSVETRCQLEENMDTNIQDDLDFADLEAESSTETDRTALA